MGRPVGTFGPGLVRSSIREPLVEVFAEDASACPNGICPMRSKREFVAVNPILRLIAAAEDEPPLTCFLSPADHLVLEQVIGADFERDRSDPPRKE